MEKSILKYAAFIALGLLLLGCDSHNATTENPEDLFNQVKRNFKNPEVHSGVNCWWWWLNGNVNKAAITKDLEAMKSRNFHGAMIFDAGGHNQRGNRDVPDGPLYGSDSWNELFVFALDEAKRLGLQMGFNIQSGWNLGGPRVTPQYAAKQLTYSQTRVRGNNKPALQLDQPESRLDYYQDIAVLAFPILASNKIQEGISDLDLKLGYHELGGSAPDCRFLLGQRRVNQDQEEEVYRVDRQEIINLSSRMDATGMLNWEIPEGEWVILRIGFTCTSSHVSTSSNDWQGSVLDYMSKEAFDFYWEDVVDPIFEAAGEHVGTTLKYMETDSWECGGMNWTDMFPEEFMHYRGYDLISYLPVVAGYVVDDMESSNAFLSDFRKTLADLVAYNHYARFQEYAHKYGMGIQPESAGPHAGPMDGIKNYGFSDIVMSEFWSPSPHRPQPNNRFFLKQASSAAHIYGKKIVGAESFTTIGPHWNDELWHDQKSAFDHEICAGLNRMYFHTFTCSPPEMGLPGQEYFAGTHVNPQVTWWDQSGAFIDYMHRTQSVVQEGKFVADVLYYYGDHVPNVFPFKHSDPAGVMPGFDYDVCDETIFLQLKVEDGKILVPGGVEYRILVLPDHRVLSLAVLEKLETLLQEGATVLGQKPEKQISLVGGKEAQNSFLELSHRIWGEASNETGERTYGKGKVAWGMSAREYLLLQNVPVDFQVLENESLTDFDYIHYTMGERDIYFVTNQTTERQKLVARFRVSGKQAELWAALSGEIREARAFTQMDGLTTIPLNLEPYGAVMVVFNEKIANDKQGSAKRNYSDFKTLAEISGEWTVHFDPQWGGPESVLFPELLDWTQHSEEGIRYYSGAAVYKKSFTLVPELREEDRYFLQLGSVKDVGIAEVKINGTDKGVIWTAPFRVEISGELEEGENTLEIKVVNSWFNRVAGDQMFPDKKNYTSTNIDLKHDFRGRPMDEIALEPSGLLGPVTIQMLDEPEQDEMDFILGQFENTLQEEDNPIKIPRTINEDGSLKTVGIYSWTSGFFAGSLWYLYELTQDEKWKYEAIKWTEALDTIQYWSGNHDVGFMMYCSYGNGLKFAGMDQYKDILLQTAESLSKRYNKNTLAIKSWDYREAWDGKTKWFYPVIIDNMMNLELMFEASKFSGNQKYSDIAIQHAETTMKNHYRDDYSCYHVIDYDTISGEVLDMATCQGFTDESSWARGQAWGLYGYVLCYRYTRDSKYLNFAENIADYMLNHKNLPEDMIPHWDYHVTEEGFLPEWEYNAADYPQIPRDASAAAITASALYELATYSSKEKQYKEAADKIVNSLLSPDYLAVNSTNKFFILNHSVGSIPHGVEIDVPLVYADYYLLEALYRKWKLSN